MNLPNHPMMSDVEARVINSYLKDGMRCLEWGSGRSTLWFPSGKDLTWLSIEHDKEWFNKLHNTNKNVKIVLLDFPEYLTYPTGKFDFILIDGIQRVNCAKQVKERGLLANGGVMFLHDCGRERYKPIFEMFSCQILTPTLGDNEDNKFNGLALCQSL